MTRIGRPIFYELSGADALELLMRHHVGRLAFTFHDRVDIEPISYLFNDGWVYARTSPGTKLSIVRHNPWVAFEVDEVESRFDWRSVVDSRDDLLSRSERGRPRSRGLRDGDRVDASCGRRRPHGCGFRPPPIDLVPHPRRSNHRPRVTHGRVTACTFSF